MDSKKALPILLAAIVVLVVGFLLLKPESEPATPTTTSATTSAPTSAPSDATTATAPAQKTAETIVIKNGEPVGGMAKLTYKQGSTVKLTVTTDGAEADVHIHGYDIEKATAPGAPAKFSFVAKDTGRFEVELHPSTQIAQLDVVP
ncbi:MAG: hypothetical protein F2813_08045 [Actinobacteria bacterium]|uniref:Unannotated protein n=1 Tax=freshwater metagenome TaxID=449393 RepID=A0A6J6A234_9ZZZZ|nr:hypothetical protein [Actinomycetota bacterium]